mmetsp:Transcript_4887/g.9322  ORF Transcript_4887/g.9322 Transcript_4887/m.9322 type:complete len:100 (-) Transcript_4887:187-486(-)
MSLMVHPAPRMRKDPAANSPNSDGSPATFKNNVGESVVSMLFIMVQPEARAVLHRQGHRRRIVPIGLSNRASWAYDCALGGRALRSDDMGDEITLSILL